MVIFDFMGGNFMFLYLKKHNDLRFFNNNESDPGHIVPGRFVW